MSESLRNDGRVWVPRNKGDHRAPGAMAIARSRIVMSGIACVEMACWDIVGKAVIVHKDADDFKTQPTGNAGGRFGCGVIQ